MNHNPHKLEVGETVILDIEFNTSGLVTIKSFTPNQMFAEVHEINDSENTWEVMTYRLTKQKL